MDDFYDVEPDMEGGKRRKTKRKVARVKIHSDKRGKFIVVNKKTYRIGHNVSKSQLQNFLQKVVINIPATKRRVYRRKNTVGQPRVSALLDQGRIAREINELQQVARLRAEQELVNRQQAQAQLIRRIQNPGPQLKSDIPTWPYIPDISDFKIPPQENPPAEPLPPTPHPSAQEALAEQQAEEKKVPASLSPHPPSTPPPRRVPRPRLRSSETPQTPLPPRARPAAGELSEKKVREKLQGTGKNDDRGMSNHEIDQVMKDYPEYLGTISHDEIKSQILPQVRPKSRGGFIINTDPRSKAGEHWQACYFDARPDGEHEIDFFDSYGDPMDEAMLRDMKFLADQLACNCYLKLKENKIKYQSANSSNCGWFSCKFLIDRFRGKPFVEASGFSNVVQGERNIERFKEQHGGFARYLRSFETQAGDGLFYTEFPGNVKKYLTDEKITSIRVGRLPISKGITNVLNIVSANGWKKALEEVGYADAFHLYLVLTGTKGTYRLERNHVVTMFPYSKPSGEESLEVPLGGKNITMKEFLENTANKVGPELFRYDAQKSNCQIFVIQALSANGLLNSNAQTFIKQDIEKVVSKLPWYSRWIANLAKAVTDVAHIGTKIIRGEGEEN